MKKEKGKSAFHNINLILCGGGGRGGGGALLTLFGLRISYFGKGDQSEPLFNVVNQSNPEFHVIDYSFICICASHHVDL